MRADFRWGLLVAAYLLVPGSPMTAQDEPSEATGIELIGNVRFQPLDEDSDGLAEALAADVEVRLNRAGEYTLVGQLWQDGQRIANRPFWESASKIRAVLDEDRGTYTVREGHTVDGITFTTEPP